MSTMRETMDIDSWDCRPSLQGGGRSGEAGPARKTEPLEHHHDGAKAREGSLHEMGAEDSREPKPVEIDVNREQDAKDDEPADGQKDRAF
jgi:hypothetical protein